MQRHIYYVRGMHCSSCEIVIEKELLNVEGVKLADADISRGEVAIEFEGKKPLVNHLNKIFSKSGYIFSDKPFIRPNSQNFLIPASIAIFLIIVFFGIAKLGLVSFLNISSTSSFGVFFLFGILAGLSSCAALIGGLVLSLSKQWFDMYGYKDSFFGKTKPHLLFNSGRIFSYSLLGAVLGLLGDNIKISQGITSFLVILISLLMFVIAMQMLGVQFFNRFRIALPKNISGKVLQGEKNDGKGFPFFIGFLTFLLPCGFTIVAEGAAVLSGDPVRGLLIMLFFVLGTAIPLLFIGISSSEFASSHKFSDIFSKTAGLLILFFVVYNLFFQFGLANYFIGQNRSSDNSISVLPADTQIIKTTYSNSKDIIPNSFEVSVGKPVRFEVKVSDTGYGCMSTIMVPGLWNRPEPLIKGRTIVMEFTPEKTGSFRITCAMGVPRGIINVK